MRIKALITTFLVCALTAGCASTIHEVRAPHIQDLDAAIDNTTPGEIGRSYAREMVRFLVEQKGWDSALATQAIICLCSPSPEPGSCQQIFPNGPAIPYIVERLRNKCREKFEGEK